MGKPSPYIGAVDCFRPFRRESPCGSPLCARGKSLISPTSDGQKSPLHPQGRSSIVRFLRFTTHPDGSSKGSRDPWEAFFVVFHFSFKGISIRLILYYITLVLKTPKFDYIMEDGDLT
jgi:hypothetical protein